MAALEISRIQTTFIERERERMKNERFEITDLNILHLRTKRVNLYGCMYDTRRGATLRIIFIMWPRFFKFRYARYSFSISSY